jgi:para-nitrobenzyl esterase
LAGTGEGKTDPLYGGPGTQWSTDTGFRCPSTAQAVGQAAAGRIAYEYEFEQPPPGRPATAHASELNFLFGTWPQNTKLSPADEKVSQQMQAYWVNFAKTGNPNGAGLPVWPKFAAASQEYLAHLQHHDFGGSFGSITYSFTNAVVTRFPSARAELERCSA